MDLIISIDFVELLETIEDMLYSYKIIYRDVRGHRHTQGNSVKLGKNGTNRLKIKEKAKILAKEHFSKMRKSAEKRNSHTPGYTVFIFSWRSQTEDAIASFIKINNCNCLDILAFPAQFY